MTKNLYAATDAEVDVQLKMIQKNLSSLVPIEEERPVQAKDIILIDYEVFQDGQNPDVHLVDEFKHSFVAGIAGTRMWRNIWFVEPAGATSHNYRVRAVDQENQAGEMSDVITVNYEDWWKL